MLREIRAKIGKLKEWLSEIIKAKEALRAEPQRPNSPDLSTLLFRYLDIQKTNLFGKIVHLYNADVLQNETFTCVQNGGPVGVLFFVKHFTWYSKTEHFHRLIPCIYALNNETANELLHYATDWMRANKDSFWGKNPALASWIDAEKTAELADYKKTKTAPQGPLRWYKDGRHERVYHLFLSVLN